MGMHPYRAAKPWAHCCFRRSRARSKLAPNKGTTSQHESHRKTRLSAASKNTTGCFLLQVNAVLLCQLETLGKHNTATAAALEALHRTTQQVRVVVELRSGRGLTSLLPGTLKPSPLKQQFTHAYWYKFQKRLPARYPSGTCVARRCDVCLT